MSDITLNQALTAYIKMREAVEKRTRELKEFKNSIQDQQDTLEKFIMTEMNRLDLNSVNADGNTAYQHEKDSVTIEDKDEFKTLLLSNMLLTIQPHMYKTMEGEWHPSGEADLADHVASGLDSGMFELLMLSANKTNCKQYMSEHEGLMPAGVKYSKEIVIQVRKGRK